MTKASSGGHHSEVTPWSPLRPPGSFFAVVNLTCWIGACLPSVIAEATTLDIYDSTFQFPKMYTIYFLHSFFIEFFIFSIRRDTKFQTLDSLFQFQIDELLRLQSFRESVWRKQQTYEKGKLYFTQMSSLSLWSMLLSKAMLGQ